MQDVRLDIDDGNGGDPEGSHQMGADGEPSISSQVAAAVGQEVRAGKCSYCILFALACPRSLGGARTTASG